MSIPNTENTFSGVEVDEPNFDIIAEEEVATLSDEDLANIEALLNPYLNEVKGHLNQFNSTVEKITQAGDSELHSVEVDVDQELSGLLENSEKVGLDTVRAQIEAQDDESQK